MLIHEPLPPSCLRRDDTCQEWQTEDWPSASWKEQCQQGAPPLAGIVEEGAHLEDDAIAGSDEALDDEQPLPAPQMSQAVHVQQPRSQRRPYDLDHKDAIRPEPSASHCTDLMPLDCAKDHIP